MAEKKGWFPNIMKSVRGALGTTDEEEAVEAREAAAQKPEPSPEPVAAAPAPEIPLPEAPAKKAPAEEAPAKTAPKEDRALREIKIPEQSVDIRAVREHMNLTQAEFAKAYGFSIHTLRKWEQGVREPEKPTRILLMMIRDKPEVVNAYLDEISLK